MQIPLIQKSMRRQIMNELKIIIKAVTADAQKNMQAVKKELQGISKEAQGTSEKFAVAMKGIAKAVGVAIAGITAVITAITAFGKSTLDVQRQQAQLVAAFQAAGRSATDAASVYKDFFRFLGESDRAIEASNLLIKLTQDEKNLAQWTKILQGVYATFPDSLPIEGLVESANETARVGVVTGNLADALNWAGASEDAFNAKLAETVSLEEREALIRNTLNNLYGRAAQIYEQNNKAMLEHNESQANLNQASAALGATITPLLTAINNLATTVLNVLKPAFEGVLPYIVGFVLWLTEAINRTAAFTGAVSSTSNAATNAGESLDGAFSNANGTLEETKKQIDAIKKATMGFDELNVVPSEQSTSSSAPNLGDINAGEVAGSIGSLAGSLDEFRAKADAVKESINQWMDDWGWALKVIGGIIAALSLRNLIIQFGSLIGLADVFKKALSVTGIAGGIKSLAGWLGAVIGLMKEGNSFFAVMGAAFPKLAGVLTKVGVAIKGLSFKSLLAGIKTVASKFGWIGAIIVAVISAIQYAVGNWQSICNVFKAWVDTNLTPKIKEIGKLFKDMGSAITSAIPQSWVDWIKGAVQWLGDAFAWLWEWIGGIVFHTVVSVVMSAISAIINAVKGIVQVVTGVVQVVVGIVEALIKTIIAIFTGNWDAVLDPLRKIWDGVVNIFSGLYNATIGVVVELVKGIIDWFVQLWDELVGHSIVPDMIIAIIQWFADLPVKVFELVAGFVEGVINFFTDLANRIGEWAVIVWDNIKKPFVAVGNWFGDRWTDVKNAFSNVGSWFSDVFSKAYDGATNAFKNAKTGFGNVWSNIKAGFGNVSDWFKNTFSKAWQAVKDVFSTGGKIFDGIKDGILDGLKAVINGLIEGINKVIKIPFNGIKSALDAIRDVEILGVSPFSWMPTISIPQIPKLAKGGIVDEATIALIGERGKEAVVPLENNTEWMDKFIDKLLVRQQAPTKVVLMVDGRELGWANINSINNITRQTGALQLQLV